jgi:hypothetical protein
VVVVVSEDVDVELLLATDKLVSCGLSKGGQKETTAVIWLLFSKLAHLVGENNSLQGFDIGDMNSLQVQQ